MLVAEGELDLQTAVDELQVNAVASGIVDAVGQHQVKKMIAQAFAWREQCRE
jgi:hypothetical protein